MLREIRNWQLNAILEFNKTWKKENEKNKTKDVEEKQKI